MPDYVTVQHLCHLTSALKTSLCYKLHMLSLKAVKVSQKDAIKLNYGKRSVLLLVELDPHERLQVPTMRFWCSCFLDAAFNSKRSSRWSSVQISSDTFPSPDL